MRVDLFDFTLPPGKIAQQPASPRHAARLMMVQGDNLTDKHVYDLPRILKAGDLLIFNNSKVIPAALSGKVGDRSVKINLHKFQDGTCQDDTYWWAFAKPAKHLPIGAEIKFADDFTACVEAIRPYGERLLRFGEAGEFWHKLEQYGTMPLPPYIKRPANGAAECAEDARHYQTVFAEKNGAVAAPTAGLHFSESLLDELKSAGIGTAFVTLHVGGGTFLPVRTEDTASHQMHSEYGEVAQEVCDKITATKKQGGRIIAVGTTSLRILETAARLHNGDIKAFSGETDIFITPGFHFAVVDWLMTNFHLPRSTLFMLVAAFSGLETMQKAYAHAIEGDYRFFSYGDACLLERRLERQLEDA